MDDEFALVRKAIRTIPEVNRTWFEWSVDSAHVLRKTLVVEVSFDTDPNRRDFNPAALERIIEFVRSALEKTTMSLSDVRIVPDLRPAPG